MPINIGILFASLIGIRHVRTRPVGLRDTGQVHISGTRPDQASISLSSRLVCIMFIFIIMSVYLFFIL